MRCIVFVAAKPIAGDRPELEAAELQDAKAHVVGAFELDDAIVADACGCNEREADRLVGFRAFEFRRDEDGAADLPLVAKQPKRISRTLRSRRDAEYHRRSYCNCNAPRKQRRTVRHQAPTNSTLAAQSRDIDAGDQR